MTPPRPALLGTAPDVPADAYILCLHGGRIRSYHRDRQYRSTSLWRITAFHRLIRRRLRHVEDVTVGAGVVRYRYLGWNGRDRAPVRDTLSLVDELLRRHGSDLPIVLLGHSMGGRIAGYIAEARPENVAGVFALAPWWPEREGLKLVAAGAPVRVLHGTRDVFTSARSSRRQVAQLRERGIDAEWAAIDGGGHYMVGHVDLWHQLSTEWVAQRAVEVARLQAAPGCAGEACAGSACVGSACACRA